MLAWVVISRHNPHRRVPRPTSSLPPTAPFPLSPFPATLPKNLPVSLIIATLPKSLSVTPVVATLPRPPGGRYLTSQPALHPLPCIPSPCPPIPLSCYPLSFHTLAHSFALTKNSTLLFSSDSALFAKNRRGWGRGVPTRRKGSLLSPCKEVHPCDRQEPGLLWGSACRILLFRVASNSSPGTQPASVGSHAAFDPSTNANLAMTASPVKSMSCSSPHSAGWPAYLIPSLIENAGTPTRARLKWSER